MLHGLFNKLKVTNLIDGKDAYEKDVTKFFYSMDVFTFNIYIYLYLGKPSR